MSYQDKLQQIDELQQQIAAHGKLPDEVLKKINYKFRLEWNYTSNSMEGNTLTRAETKEVMAGNITVSGKPVKDIKEMKGHDEVITTIMKIGKGELNISEARIKEIHKGIMYEEDEDKKKMIGQWKKQNNYIINYKNERFDFADSADVHDKMHQLINWLSTEKEKIQRGDTGALHPVTLALQFHLDYVTIHPFHDGNGRTTRIFTNLILISYGYPPLYIKEGERELYMKCLADVQAYGENNEVLFEYMANALLQSQMLVLDAIKGKEIVDRDDFEKELQLLMVQTSKEKEGKSPKYVYSAYNSIERVLVPVIKSVVTRFEKFFSETKMFKTLDGYRDEKRETRSIVPTWTVEAGPFREKILGHDVYETEINSAEWKLKLYALKGAEKHADFEVKLEIYFYAKQYTVKLYLKPKTGDGGALIEKEVSYNYVLSEKSVEEYSAVLKHAMLAAIKTHIKTNN